MPPQEQADLWMALRDRMKTDWHELTVPEKKAGEQHSVCPPIVQSKASVAMDEVYRLTRDEVNLGMVN
jgi:cytochrome c oxidase subunit IV